MSAIRYAESPSDPFSGMDPKGERKVFSVLSVLRLESLDGFACGGVQDHGLYAILEQACQVTQAFADQGASAARGLAWHGMFFHLAFFTF